MAHGQAAGGQGHGRLAGLLYLENTLTTHAFNVDRVAVLDGGWPDNPLNPELTAHPKHAHRRVQLALGSRQ